ncbi:MAG: hypothetical protein ACRC9X_06395 [Bacteroidales bacterium]
MQTEKEKDLAAGVCKQNAKDLSELVYTRSENFKLELMYEEVDSLQKAINLVVSSWVATCDDHPANNEERIGLWFLEALRANIAKYREAQLCAVHKQILCA